MNFAPYQDETPQVERALSPPPPPLRANARSSIDSPRVQSPPARSSLSSSRAPLEGHVRGGAATGQPGHTGHGLNRPQTTWPSSRDSQDRGQSLQAFQTSLPLRMDFEAMLAYLALPPIGGVVLLVLEHNSDYVRFHAWQSSMLFSALVLLHILLSWSSVLSWLLFGIDVCLIGFLAMHAYRDVDTLDHFELGIFGRLANSFVDNE